MCFPKHKRAEELVVENVPPVKISQWHPEELRVPSTCETIYSITYVYSFTNIVNLEMQE